VYFTKNVFAPTNPLLSEIVTGGGGDLPRKILVVVDQGLYRHHLHLLDNIAEYLEHHSGQLQIACPHVLVPEGAGKE
jgi:3-dehydroquinate synthase